MAVSKALILELQTIIREDYGKELEFLQVSILANDMVGYFDLLAKLHHQHNEYESPKKQSEQQ